MLKKLGWLLKRFPHPSYGSYGGFYRRCKNRKERSCPLPIDWMDEAFKDHDLHILNNNDLVNVLKYSSPKTLKRPIYGKLYRWGTIAVFSVANFFSR